MAFINPALESARTASNDNFQDIMTYVRTEFTCRYAIDPVAAAAMGNRRTAQQRSHRTLFERWTRQSISFGRVGKNRWRCSHTAPHLRPPVPPSIVREPRSSRCKACNEPRCLANVMRAVALNAASAHCSGVGRRGWRTSIQPSIPDANEEVFVADLAALKDKFQRCRSIKSVSQAYRRARGLRNRMTQSECPDMELAEGMA